MAWVAVNHGNGYGSEEMLFAIKPSRIDDFWWIVEDMDFATNTGEQLWVTVGDRTFVGDEIDENRSLLKDVARVSFERNHTGIELPKGSIEKLIGRTLTWEDEPVEIK